VSSVVVIVASVLCAVGASATLAVALGRAAARGDEELARELAREGPPAAEPVYETFSVPSIPAWRWPGTEQ